jgi:hypothetical protein
MFTNILEKNSNKERKNERKRVKTKDERNNNLTKERRKEINQRG